MICRPARCLLFSIIVFWIAPAVSAELRKVPPLPPTHGTEVIVDDVLSLKQVANNLIRGAIMPEGDDALLDVRLENNVTGPLMNYFVDPSAGDLRITARAAEALNAGIPLPDVTEDFDGHPRNTRPDVGAAELVTPEARGR